MTKCAIAVALIASCVFLPSCSRDVAPPIEDGRWQGWQEYTIELPHDTADVLFFDLSEGQRIQMVFHLRPTTSELQVAIGNVIRPNRPDWQWGFKEDAYPPVHNEDAITFRASQTYSYGVWMKPTKGGAVTVRLQYRFGNWG